MLKLQKWLKREIDKSWNSAAVVFCTLSLLFSFQGMIIVASSVAFSIVLMGILEIQRSLSESLSENIEAYKRLDRAKGELLIIKTSELIRIRRALTESHRDNRLMLETIMNIDQALELMLKGGNEDAEDDFAFSGSLFHKHKNSMH